MSDEKKTETKGEAKPDTKATEKTETKVVEKVVEKAVEIRGVMRAVALRRIITGTNTSIEVGKPIIDKSTLDGLTEGVHYSMQFVAE